MGLQIIVAAARASDVEARLGAIAARCEVFSCAAGHFGVSIPTALVDEASEASIWKRLGPMRVFDLYQGRWRRAE